MVVPIRQQAVGVRVIVCQCAVVSDRDLAAAFDDGARTLGQACRQTGAGQDCGSCVFSLKRMLCEHGETRLTTEVEVAAS